MPEPDRLFRDAAFRIPVYSKSVPLASGSDAPTLARLEQLKSLLRSAAQSGLSALGPMSLRGNLAPSIGLATPRLPALLGEARPFQSAHVSVPGAPQALVRAGGVARVVEAAPLAPAERTPTARSLVELGTAYWAATSIDISDGTVVVLQTPVRALVIIAERVTFGRGVTFTWERPPATQLPRKPDKPPKPLAAPTATDNDPPPGAPGLPGVPGDPAGVHFTATDGPEVEIWALELSGQPSFDLRGQDGVPGTPGGDGGDGGDGAPGRPDAVDTFGFCKRGPGNGGDGGPGGRAGEGGRGGDGGAGGRLTLYVPEQALVAFAAGMSINVDGGSPGAGGIPGIPGAGGDGGARGDNSHGCNPATPRNAGRAGAQGTPGTAGAPGREGAQREGAVSLHPIDRAQFLAELEKPSISTVSPDPVAVGQRITISGALLARTDRVVVGGVACETQFLDQATLQCTVPAVGGGPQVVQLTRPDGTTSNRASVYVRPVLGQSQPVTRAVPGTTVRLAGTGFAPGMHVQVNGQDMPQVKVLDTRTVEFALVRPASVVQNASGEAVTVRVVLADAGKWSASNAIPFTLDTFRMLVFGDSIAWGQGLEEANKFHSLIEAEVRRRHGEIGVYKDVRAHSGASLMPLRSDTAWQTRLPGEVPTFYPTVREQVLEFESVPGAKNDVDLILLDGGINDVGVPTILWPATSSDAIVSKVEQFCHTAMLALLIELGRAFPKARIVVTGYYQVISEQSDLALLDVFMCALGFDLASVPGAIVGALATTGIRKLVSDNCALFAREANRRLALAVAEANAGIPAAPPRVFFADPGFTPANAALAPEALVYGIHADLSPEDPASVAGPRASACDAAGSSNTSVPECKRASVGHPNDRGARAYASAIAAQL